MADDTPGTDDGQHTGGMIALVPTEQGAADLAVPGGEDPDQLHVTLLYLGDDVSGWSPQQRENLVNLVRSVAAGHSPVAARAFGHAQFNPDGGADGDRDPCAVYLIGDTRDAGDMRDWLHSTLTDGDDFPTPPDQHTPYVPHVTAGYGMTPADLSYAGPVDFDRMRVALGNDTVDIPLGDPDDQGDADQEDASDDDQEEWSGWYDEPEGEKTLDGLEHKVASPDPRAARLRRAWAFDPKLRAKWKPGVPGDFKRLRRHLAKYVHVPHVLDGLTANIHHLALGVWPGRELPGAAGHKALFDDDSPEVVSSADVDSDGDDDPEVAALFDGIEPEALLILLPGEIDERGDDEEDGQGDDEDSAGGIPVEADEGLAIKGVLLTAAEVAQVAALDLKRDPGSGPAVSIFDQYDQAASRADGDPVSEGDEEDSDSWTDVLARDKAYLLTGSGDIAVDPRAEQGKLNRDDDPRVTGGGGRSSIAPTTLLNGPASLFDGV